MKKVRKITAYLILSVMLITGLSPYSIYADEITDEEIVITSEPEESESDYDIISDPVESEPDEIEEVYSENEEPSSEDEIDHAEAEPQPESEEDPDMVTEIGGVDDSKFVYEYKPALTVLLNDFPKTITIYRGDVKEKVDAAWKCEEDYDELLGEYHFIPDLGESVVSSDVELPRITVIVENESAGETGPVMYDELDFEVPSVGSNMRKGRRTADFSGDSSEWCYNYYSDGVTLPDNLPSVRNQNPYGTCWAFSTIGSIEADVIADGSSADLSETHLAYYVSHSYNDPKGCRTDSAEINGNANAYLMNGGSVIVGARVLSNLVGAVSESDAPYENALSFSPDDSYVTSKDVVQIRNAYYINIKDRDMIKAAIKEHGAVSASYLETKTSTTDNNYSATYNSYYCPKTGHNHSVMLVGWNDRFTKENFRGEEKPEDDGAWLVRNSWGDNGYSHLGYFWMSYYDISLNSTEEVVAFDTSRDTFDNCYSYDGQPCFDFIFDKVSSPAEVAVTYNVSGGEAVKGVAFEVGTANVTANVTATNKKTSQSVSKSIHTTFAGIYTAEFDEPLEVSDDADVEVTIEYTSDDNSAIVIISEATGQKRFGDYNLLYTGVSDK